MDKAIFKERGIGHNRVSRTAHTYVESIFTKTFYTSRASIMPSKSEKEVAKPLTRDIYGWSSAANELPINIKARFYVQFQLITRALTSSPHTHTHTKLPGTFLSTQYTIIMC